MSIRIVADENISWRIKKLMHWDILPANEIKNGKRLSDLDIWQYARTNQYSILTFDEDFSELQNLFSFPPKIIWLRTGNISTTEIVNRLNELENHIADFLNNNELGVYEIYI